jgi:hypothetical protein
MNIKDKVVYIATLTLMMVVIGMMVSFVFAVLDPHYDDDKIFAIIGPAFQTISRWIYRTYNRHPFGFYSDEKRE